MVMSDIVEGFISSNHKPCVMLSLFLFSIGYALCLLTLGVVFAIIKVIDNCIRSFNLHVLHLENDNRLFK